MLQPAPVQTAYTRYIPIGQNGMLADEVNWSADSRIVETAAGIGFGLAVSQGVNANGCIIGGSAYVGVTRADPTLARADLAPAAQLGIDIYPQYDNAGILTMGDLWVFAYAAVAVGAAVTFEVATGKLGIAGTTIPNARWMTATTASGQLAVVRLANIAGR